VARVDADVHGLLIADKPAGVTSHDVVAQTRRRFGTRRVGHAGTLDPSATGVLVLGLGKATRLLTYLVGDDKDYAATIRLGASTATDDAEGEVISVADVSQIAALTDDAINLAAIALTGEILQRPSSVSAIKINGQRAYSKVRAGEEVDIAPRPVTVYEFSVDEVRRGEESVDVDVRVRVSSGTYVRALARDLGNALGVGGHLTALRRTRSGRFSVADVADELVPLGTALSQAMPAFALTAEQVIDVRYGRSVAAPDSTGGTVGPVGLMDAHGDAIAIAEAREGRFVPKVVFT